MNIFMKIIPTGIFLVSYYFAGDLIQHKYTVIAFPAIALLYIWGHVKLAGNSVRTALSIVLAFTAILPLVILFLIGYSSHGTWQETISAMYNSFSEHNQFNGLEVFFPFLVSVIGALLLTAKTNRSRNGTR